MKLFAFLVSFLLFVGGILLMGFAFSFGAEWHVLAFAGGIAAISVSLMVPFHLLDLVD